MQLAQIDQQEFADGQRRSWNEAAKGWREWSEFINWSTASVSERLVAMAGVAPGHRVLDVAAGYGEPSLAAARTVGAQGEVVATDISAGIVRVRLGRGVHAQYPGDDPAGHEHAEAASTRGKEQVWQAVTDSARSRASEDGTVRLTNLVLLAAAGRA